MDTRDRRFHELENSLHAREGSTTLIATVASSASVILLAAFDVKFFPQIILFLGLLFPLVGETYRELTIMTIDAIDFAELRTLYPPLLRDDKEIAKRFKMFGWYRRGSIRAMLLAPSFVWAYDLWRGYVGGTSSFITAFALAVTLGGLSVSVLVLDWIAERRKQSARRLADELKGMRGQLSYW